MIIFGYGKDSQRLNVWRKEIIDSFRTKYPSGFNFIECDISQSDQWPIFESAVKMQSFFDEKKLISSKNVFESKTAAEDFLKMIKDADCAKSGHVVILVAEPFDKKELAAKHKELTALLIGSSKPVEIFEPLSSGNLSSWIRREVQKYGSNIEPGAASEIVSRVGMDTHRLENEIIKLVNYKGKGTISTADIDALIAEPSQMNIFHLVDAVATRNRAVAFSELYSQLKNQTDPFQILGAIIYQFRNLIMVKSMINDGCSLAEIKKSSGLHPFVAQKTIDQSRSFEMDDLKNIYSRLEQLDVASKSGQTDLALALNQTFLAI